MRSVKKRIENMDKYILCSFFVIAVFTFVYGQDFTFVPPAPMLCEDDEDFEEYCSEFKKKKFCETKQDVMDMICAKTCEYCPDEKFSKDVHEIIKDQKKVAKAAGGKPDELKEGLKKGKGSPNAGGKFEGKGETDAEKEATEVPEKEDDGNKDGDKKPEDNENGSESPAASPDGDKGKDKGDESGSKGDQSKGKGDQSKGNGDQSKGKGDQSVNQGDQSKGKGDQSKGKGDQSKGKGDQSKGKGNQSQGKDDQSQGKGDESKGKGDKSENKGDESKGKGDQCQGKGDQSKEKGGDDGGSSGDEKLGGDVGDVGSTIGCDKKCQTECVQAHNKYRANHGAPPLKWDQTLATQAQAVADKNAAGNKFEHSDWAAGKGGECIAWGPVKPTWLIAVKDWHDEEKNYDYKTGKSSNGKAIGHFTQVVWKKATKVGCAKSEMTMYGSKGPFYIAQMDVVGIVQGKEELDLVGKPKENDLDWFKGLRDKQMKEAKGKSRKRNFVLHSIVNRRKKSNAHRHQ